jgi:hypothetical protein
MSTQIARGGKRHESSEQVLSFLDDGLAVTGPVAFIRLNVSIRRGGGASVRLKP